MGAFYEVRQCGSNAAALAPKSRLLQDASSAGPRPALVARPPAAHRSLLLHTSLDHMNLKSLTAVRSCLLYTRVEVYLGAIQRGAGVEMWCRQTASCQLEAELHARLHPKLHREVWRSARHGALSLPSDLWKAVTTIVVGGAAG